jgi:hypothetical protein
MFTLSEDSDDQDIVLIEFCGNDWILVANTFSDESFFHELADLNQRSAHHGGLSMHLLPILEHFEQGHLGEVFGRPLRDNQAFVLRMLAKSG